MQSFNFSRQTCLNDLILWLRWKQRPIKLDSDHLIYKKKNWTFNLKIGQFNLIKLDVHQANKVRKTRKEQSIRYELIKNQIYKHISDKCETKSRTRSLWETQSLCGHESTTSILTLTFLFQASGDVSACH